jgi:hypothetical protein
LGILVIHEFLEAAFTLSNIRPQPMGSRQSYEKLVHGRVVL